MKIISILSLTIALASCATRIDHSFREEVFSKNLPASKIKCVKAISKSLAVINAKIEKTYPRKFELLTNRFITHQSSVGVTNIYGDANYASGVTTASQNTEYAQIKFKITGNEKQCQVKSTLFRYWLNTKQLDDVRKSWIKNNLATPLYKEALFQIEQGD